MTIRVTNDMLTSIYEQLRARGLTRSRRHFSVTWCGRAGNYLCEAVERPMSSATAIEVVRRLVAAREHELAADVLDSLAALPMREVRHKQTDAPDHSKASRSRSLTR